MPVADCGVFEVGERSEVGALESPAKRERSEPHFAALLPLTLAQRATNAQPKTLAQRATNVSETNKINYKQFNTKNKSYEKNFCNPNGVGNVFFRKRCSNGSRRS